MVFDKFGNFQESRFFSQDGENKFFLDYISNFFTKKHKRKKRRNFKFSMLFREKKMGTKNHL